MNATERRADSPLEVTKNNIWNYKQNKPSLIAKDIEELTMLPQRMCMKILMSRGVFKWFRVRREIIRLKESWKKQITMLQGAIQGNKETINTKEKPTYADHYNHGYAKGYHDALTECRNQIRLLCHSQRWTCPDNDIKSWEILNNPDHDQLI
jgi:flagellar biosynthesis/type III secretory pathway protein FliH